MPDDTSKELKNVSPEQQLFYLRAKELELKKIELEQKKKETTKQWWQNPLYLAIFGLFGNILVSYYNNSNDQKIERDKVNSTAILEAIKTGDTTSAKNNLKFLLAIGFLNDKDGKIKKYLENTNNLPVLPSSSNVTNETQYSYSRTDTLNEESPLYKLSATVGLLKFYNNDKLELSLTAVAFNENTIAVPKLLISDNDSKERIIFTIDYNSLTSKVKDIELIPTSNGRSEESDFYFFKPKDKFKFKNNLSQFQFVLPKIDQPIMIIQHPRGVNKRIAINQKFKILNINKDKKEFYYNATTEPGSAGGLIITNDFKIVGLHIGKGNAGKFGVPFKSLK